LEKFKELTSQLAQEGDDILCALGRASLHTLNNHITVHRYKQKINETCLLTEKNKL
jgi:hypothetical protein